MGLFSRSQLHSVAAGRTLGRELAPSEHTGWRKLVLVRHGQTDFNVQHRLPGQLPGIPLNATGQQEARMTAESIRALPLTAIVASPLERTMETAAFVNQGRGLPIRQDRDLLDTNYGPYNGKNWDELDKTDPAWQRFTKDPGATPPKGAESFAAVQRRAVRAAERWRQATDVGEWLALVTHADLVKMIVGHYLGIPLANCPLMNMDNASVSLLTFHPDPKELPSLLCFNWTSPAVWLMEAQAQA
jgi:broad specificity phosphatase PhoE